MINGMHMRETIRAKWVKKKNEMWRNIVRRIELEEDSRRFRTEIERTLEKRKWPWPWIETHENENRVDLKTTEEMDTEFQRRLEKTFNISGEENEYFSKEMEKEMEE